MAWSIIGVATNAESAGGSGATTTGFDSSGADLTLIGIADSVTPMASPTVSDNKGNTYTPLTSIGTDFIGCKWYYCDSPTVGAGHTAFYVGGGAHQSSVALIALSGADASAFSNEGGSATSVGTAPTSYQAGSFTPAQDDCLILGLCAFTFPGGTLSGVDGGFSIDAQSASVFFGGRGIAVAHLEQTTATAVNPTWSQGSTNGWAVSYVALKQAGAGSPGGGTEFDEDYAGTITPAGALFKQVNKAFSGSVSTSGALSQQLQASYSGSSTPAGAIAKQTGKGTQGLLTPSGDPNLDMGKFLAGSTTPAGTIAKQTGKPLAGSIASSGDLSIIRAILRTFEGAITPVGALAFSIGKALTGLVTPAGALAKAISHALSGSSTPTGAVQKQTGKAVSGSVTPTGDLSTFRLVILALAGTIAPVGELVKSISKRFVGLIASIGSLLIEGGTPQAPPLFGGTIHIQPEPHTVEIMENRTVHIPGKGYES